MQKKIKQATSKINYIKQCVLIPHQLPLSSVNPVSLFPTLNSIASIQYTINWLSQGGVEEIFILYSHSQIEPYFKTNKFADIKIILKYVKSQQLKNVGDAMRQIQFRNIVSDQFLLVYGDTVSNINLNRMITKHISNKNDLKNVIITVGLTHHRGKCLYILNSDTQQIVQIANQKSDEFTLFKDRVNIKKINIELRRDLSPAQVYICTVQSLKLFKQNFQYNSMDDFYHGILTSEVYDFKICTYILPKNQLSFRLTIPSDYYRCYMNYICRNLYPYTLQNSSNRLISKGKKQQQFYVCDFNKVFKKNVTISDTTFISNNCYFGENIKIGKNCKIIKSVINGNNQIKDNVQLNNCIITQGCNISDNSKYQYCLIEKIKQSIKVHSFKDFIIEEPIKLIKKELFLVSPPNQESTLEEQLQNMMDQDPDQGIVQELYSIRKHHNIQLDVFLKEMLLIAAPVGVKGLQAFSNKWGATIKQMHQNNQLDTIQSLFVACKLSQKYKKAFHLFIQFFYKVELLTNEKIIQWYENKSQSDTSDTLELCRTFIELLNKADEQIE